MHSTKTGHMYTVDFISQFSAINVLTIQKSLTYNSSSLTEILSIALPIALKKMERQKDGNQMK